MKQPVRERLTPPSGATGRLTDHGGAERDRAAQDTPRYAEIVDSSVTPLQALTLALHAAGAR